MKEGDIRKALKERVEAYGGEIRAVAWLGRRHAPDVLTLFPQGALHPGTFPSNHPFIETKRPGKDATDGQVREHERMRAAGCVVIIITSLKQLDLWFPPL